MHKKEFGIYSDEVDPVSDIIQSTSFVVFALDIRIY
jgi:hypothetical protein